MEFLGVDIGGTKCAVVRGTDDGKIIEKEKFPTKDEMCIRDRSGISQTERRLIGLIS